MALLWPCKTKPITHQASAQKPNHLWYIPYLTILWYLALIDAGIGYHNLKLDKKSWYLTICACQYGMYRYVRLPFGAAPTGHMFQCKMNKIFKDMTNFLAIVGNILVIIYHGNGHDISMTLQWVLQICITENLKHNKDKCHFWCMLVPILGEDIPWCATRPSNCMHVQKCHHKICEPSWDLHQWKEIEHGTTYTRNDMRNPKKL